jgi:cytochrome c oxidase subunit IV
MLLFSFTITGKAIDEISKAYSEIASVSGYARLALYAVFISIAIGIIVQPFSNVTAIIQTFAWGLAIAFAIIIPLVYALAKKIIQ